MQDQFSISANVNDEVELDVVQLDVCGVVLGTMFNGTELVNPK